MTEFFSKCSKCGVDQKKVGYCWDYGMCGKCFNSQSMSDIKKTI